MGESKRDVLERRAEAGSATAVAEPARHWFFAWLAFLPVPVARAENLAESDTFWQVRTGLFTLGQHRIPTVDPFSWTAHGEPWTLNSWGFNVALAAAYQSAGLLGVALACAVVVAAIGALVLALCRKLGASALVSGWLLVLCSPLLIAWLSARPQLVDYAAVLVLVMLLRRTVEGNRPLWTLAALAALGIGWVNLHASVLLGVAIVGATDVAVALRRTTRGRTGWCLAALLATMAGSLANPYGIGLVGQTLQVRSASSTVITEWQPLNPADPTQIVPFVLGLLALVVAVRRGDAVFAAALGVAACGSVAAIRILPILLLLSLPVLASFVSRPGVLRYVASRRRLLSVAATMGLAAAVGITAVNLPFLGRPDPAKYPTAAIAAIPSGCRLFNEYRLGGLVLLERPDVPVSLDSRNDLYGERHVTHSLRVLDGQGDWEKGLAGAGCVLVAPTSGLAHRLRESAAWELTSAEPTAELFVRR